MKKANEMRAEYRSEDLGRGIRGKTTFAREFLPTDAELPNFVNADLIAAGLSPFAPDVAAFKAGRIMLETIAEYVKHGESFSFETTLSPLLNPPPQAGEEANESLREFYVTAPAGKNPLDELFGKP